MSRKKNTPKLVLKTETLRHLQPHELAHAAGAANGTNAARVTTRCHGSGADPTDAPD
ncbi:MAG TPA: hypothetical protein VMZ28_21165 [Kofleriaceae bacterium]|nr:hypothetical protein [Kofleriaceae bacterium]